MPAFPAFVLRFVVSQDTRYITRQHGWVCYMSLLFYGRMAVVEVEKGVGKGNGMPVSLYYTHALALYGMPEAEESADE